MFWDSVCIFMLAALVCRPLYWCGTPASNWPPRPTLLCFVGQQGDEHVWHGPHVERRLEGLVQSGLHVLRQLLVPLLAKGLWPGSKVASCHDVRQIKQHDRSTTVFILGCPHAPSSPLGVLRRLQPVSAPHQPKGQSPAAGRIQILGSLFFCVSSVRLHAAFYVLFRVKRRIRAWLGPTSR